MKLEYIIGKDYIICKNYHHFTGVLVYVFKDRLYPDCYLFAFNETHGTLPRFVNFFSEPSAVDDREEYKGFKKVMEELPNHQFLWVYEGEVIDYAPTHYNLDQLITKLENESRRT